MGEAVAVLMEPLQAQLVPMEDLAVAVAAVKPLVELRALATLHQQHQAKAMMVVPALVAVAAAQELVPAAVPVPLEVHPLQRLAELAG
jgi:hypothetical protein